MPKKKVHRIRKGFEDALLVLAHLKSEERSGWPKCPTCKRKVGILHFPNTETCYVFCCGCNYRMQSPEMWTYIDKTLFRGLHRTSDRG